MNGKSGRNRLATYVLVALVLIGAIIAGYAKLHGGLTSNSRASLSSPSASGSRILFTLPEFVLANERSESVDLYDLHGTVWVADFIFTRCAGTCPMITHYMAELQKEIVSVPSLKDVRLVSFSVDPDHDTSDVLREYGHTNGADPSRWTFLTGTRDVVRSLVHDGFKLPVGDQDDPQMPIFHSQNLVVVDRQGRVRGTFDALTEGDRKELHNVLASVLAEPGANDAFVPPNVTHPEWLASRKANEIASAASITVPHDFVFTDQIGASGITFQHGASMNVGKYYTANHYDHGTAVAAADVDGDGLTDLYFVNQVGGNKLYKNVGGGRFADITSNAGVGVGDRACVGAAFADIDNDGAPDLFVTCIRDGNILFKNDGHGHFTNVTTAAGVAGNGGHSSGAVFFDYDGDGLLDLFVTNVGKYTKDERFPDGLWKAFGDAFAGHLHRERYETSILYHNLGGGRFQDVSTTSGLLHSAWSGEATAFDYDGDGKPDLYVASMQGHGELWHNLGRGKFERISRRIFPATPWGSMGLKAFDWDGDQKLDLFVTDMHTDMSGELLPEDEKKKHDPKTMFPFRFLATDGNHILGNALFTNRGGGKFEEMSDAANAESGWPWGPSIGDLNADGWPDIFIAAGMNYPFRYRGSDVLLNEGGKRFADAAYILGIEPRQRLARPWYELDCDGEDAKHDICRGENGPVFTNDQRTPEQRNASAARHGKVTVWAARASRSAVIFDADGDGDLDIVTNNYGDIPQLFISNLAQKGPVHFLTVRLIGHRSNRDGIGAVVTLQAGGRSQMQVNDGKSGYLAQSVLPLYFGLGNSERADQIKVKWPGGKEQVVSGPIQSGTPVTVREP
jgi:cytochrome oxidase Cu insertion factor (SCO1/SenC/PrrC family)